LFKILVGQIFRKVPFERRMHGIGFKSGLNYVRIINIVGKEFNRLRFQIEKVNTSKEITSSGDTI